jgi:hypothetical protein
LSQGKLHLNRPLKEKGLVLLSPEVQLAQFILSPEVQLAQFILSPEVQLTQFKDGADKTTRFAMRQLGRVPAKQGLPDTGEWSSILLTTTTLTSPKCPPLSEVVSVEKCHVYWCSL